MSELNLSHHKKKVFHWKGKRVTEKRYNKYVNHVKLAKKLSDEYGKFMSPNPTTNDNDSGRRLVHLKTLGKNMFCIYCKSILSLTDIEFKRRIGLASMLIIKCRRCNKASGVSTDKQHLVSNGNSHYDSNTQLVVGRYTLNSFN